MLWRQFDTGKICLNRIYNTGLFVSRKKICENVAVLERWSVGLQHNGKKNMPPLTNNESSKKLSM